MPTKFKTVRLKLYHSSLTVTVVRACPRAMLESMGVEITFSGGANSGFFQLLPKGFLQVWSTVAKFHLPTPKSKEKHFCTKTLIAKYQISKSRKA